MKKTAEMTLDEVRDEIKEITPQLHKAFEEAGTELDASKITVFGEGLDARGKSEQLVARNVRLRELGERRKSLEDADAGRKAVEEAQAWLAAPAGGAPLPGGGKAYASLADLALKAKDDWLEKRSRGKTAVLSMDVKEYIERELKTVMSTGAGFAPQAIRSGVVVPAAFQRPAMIDIVPVVRTSQIAYVFMEQTTRTNAAAEIAESANGSLQTYAESAIAYTQRSETIRKIAHMLPVSDEQLEDIEGLQDLLTNDVRTGIRQRLSSQILNGVGTTIYLNGILASGRSVTDVVTTGMFVADAIAELIKTVQTTGFTEPDYFAMHPADWWGYRTATTQDGLYIAGHPSVEIPVGMWGYPGILTTELTQGKAICGNFRDFSRLAVKRDVEVLVSSENQANFETGVQTMRADMRAALALLRETAFAKTDDIVVS